MLFDEITWEQECIPVGCVPPVSVKATRCQYQKGVEYTVPSFGTMPPLESYPFWDHIPMGLSPLWDHTPSETIPLLTPYPPSHPPLWPYPSHVPSGTITPLWDHNPPPRMNMGPDRNHHHTPQKEHGTRQEVTLYLQKEHGARQEVTSYTPPVQNDRHV